MKRLMKTEKQFTLKCTAIQAFICSPPYLLHPVTQEAVCVCVCVTGNFSPKKADSRCASHLPNFPQTAGLLPVRSLLLNQPQSATCSLSCLQPACAHVSCVRACGSSSSFLLVYYVIVFRILSSPIQPSLVAKPSHDQTPRSSDPLFKSRSLSFYFWAPKDQIWTFEQQTAVGLHC